MLTFAERSGTARRWPTRIGPLRVAQLSVVTWFTVILALGAIGDPNSLSAQTPNARQAQLKVPTELLAAAASGGEVPIIIGVATSRAFRPEATLQTVDAGLQRQDIVRAQDAVLASLATAGIRDTARFETIPFLVTRVNAAALDALRSSPLVTSIEEDRQSSAQLAESTSLIGANIAWSSGYTGAGWTVAVLDTGVDKTHPFLAGKVVSEACYSNAGGFGGGLSVCPGGVVATEAPGSGLPCGPDCDHGTHVAGIAAGKGAAFSGVARDASIIAIQVFTRVPGGTTTFASDWIRGLERVFALRGVYNIAAANLSLAGGRHFSNCDGVSPSAKAAIDTLRSAGIAVVVSAGNDGFADSMGFPACISTAVSVASTADGSGGTTRDRISWFSDTASFLHLLAPGQFITSSVPGGGFKANEGTSMAAPHVAGAWALLRQRSPGSSVAMLLSALRNTGVPVFDPLNGLTFPRIDVPAALSSLCAYAVSKTSISVGAAATTDSVTVTAPSGCSWNAVSNASWLAVGSGGSASGNGTVGINIAANPGAARVGTLTIAGWTVTASQNAVLISPPTISAHPMSLTIDPGQSGKLSVSASGTAPLTYQWYAGTSGNTSSPVPGAASSAFATPALVATTSYWVRVSNAAGHANSNTAVVTVRQLFTDPVLTSGVSAIRLIHIMELRTRVDALRIRVGLGGFGWTDALSGGLTTIRAPHVTELRTALGQVYSAMMRATPSYSDPVLIRGETTMKVAHLMELRAAVTAVE